MEEVKTYYVPLFKPELMRKFPFEKGAWLYGGYVWMDLSKPVLSNLTQDERVSGLSCLQATQDRAIVEANGIGG